MFSLRSVVHGKKDSFVDVLGVPFHHLILMISLACHCYVYVIKGTSVVTATRIAVSGMIMSCAVQLSGN